MSNTIISRVLENLTSVNYIEEHFLTIFDDRDLNTIELNEINHSIEETYNELYPYLRNLIITTGKENTIELRNFFVVGVNDLKEVMDKLEEEYEDNSKEFIVPLRVRKYTLETQIKYLNQLIDRISLLTNTAPSINDSQNRLNSQQSDLDGLEVEYNESHTVRNINVVELELYFKGDFKRENPINYFNKLVDELKINKSKKEFGEIAYLIYKSEQVNNRMPKNNFNKWFQIFCNCINIDKPKYKSGVLKDPSQNLKQLFNYL